MSNNISPLSTTQNYSAVNGTANFSDKSSKKTEVEITLVFSPSEVGASSNPRKRQPTANITENQVEAKVLKHFGLDVNNNLAEIKKRLGSEANPFDELKTTGNLNAAYNLKTGNYEIRAGIESNLYKQLQGKAAQVKQAIEADKQPTTAINNSNPNTVIAEKKGIDTVPSARQELENKYSQNPPPPQNSVSALSESDRAVKSITNGLETITGTTDPFAASEVGKQFNRFGTSALRLTGKLIEGVNYFGEKFNDAVRYVAPDSVDAVLNQADTQNRDLAQSLQNAGTAVTGEDTYIDRKAAENGITIPVTEGLARKFMYFPDPQNISNAVDSAVKGDFKDDDGTYSDQVGKIISGLNPVGDVRDIIANGKRVLDGEKVSYIKFGTAVIGAAPGVGDVLKPIIKKAGKEILEDVVTEVGEKAFTKAVKEVGEEGVEKLVKETANGTQLIKDGWIGRQVKDGDTLPDGYHWKKGQISRNPSKGEDNYAKLRADENGKVGTSAAERLSNPALMNRNFELKTKADIKASNPRLSDEQIDLAYKAEKARVQIHHIIPDEIVKNSELGKAAQKAGYVVDNGNNLKGLPRSIDKTKEGEIGHWSNHPNYTELVEKEITDVTEELKREFRTTDLNDVPADVLKQEMKRIENKFRGLIENNDKSIPLKDGRLSFAPEIQFMRNGRYEIKA